MTSSILRQEGMHGASAADGGTTMSLPKSATSARAFTARSHTPMEALPFWCGKASPESSGAELIRRRCRLPDDQFIGNWLIARRCAGTPLLVEQQMHGALGEEFDRLADRRQ